MSVKVKYAIIGCVCLLMGYIIGECQFLNLFKYQYDVNTQISYTPVEYTYYMSSILTAIGTIGAVLVALFKDFIYSLFFKPKLAISLEGTNGFTENLNKDASPLKALDYRTHLVFENTGNAEAEKCELFINEIRKGRDKDHLSAIYNRGLGKPLLWDGEDSVDIPENKSKYIQILQVKPGNSLPNQGEENPPTLTIIGAQIEDLSHTSDMLEIDYCLKYHSGRQHNFTIALEWNGEWCDRKTEMNHVLNIQKN